MPQKLSIRTAAFAAASAPLTVIYAAEGEAPSGAGAAIWSATGLDWQSASTSAAFKGKQGQALDIIGQGAGRLIVLGKGKSEGDVPLNAWTDRGGSLFAKIAAARAESVAVIIEEAGATPAAIAELAAGLRLRHYKFDKYKTARPSTRKWYKKCLM